MRISFSALQSLKGKPKELRFLFRDPEIVENNRQILELSEVEFEGEALYVAGVFEVHGNLSFSAAFGCSRCLERYEEEFKVPFKELFAYGTPEEDEEKDEIHYINDDSFDLIPYLREAVLLSLPYIPLCHPSCEGLCPVCGANRNVEKCGCSEERIDPRLAELAKFFEKQSD